MDKDSGTRKHPHSRRRSWCCSFSTPPKSPENPNHHPSPKTHPRNHHHKPGPSSSPAAKHPSSLPNSPLASISGFSYRRRILSPGRVSPIDSDNVADPVAVQDIIASAPPNIAPTPLMRSDSSRVSSDGFRHLLPEEACSSSPPPPPLLPPPPPESEGSESGGGDGVFDVRLNLKGKSGGFLVLELNSEVLTANSPLFAALISENRKGSSSSASKLCRIEVPDVENLGVFRQTIELMFEQDICKHLSDIGVYRSIDVLEVCAGIMFTKGVMSCLKYIEAVPWSEEEEEKLRSLFARFNFDDATSRDISARLYSHDPAESQQNLATQLVWSIINGSNSNARNELKSLVKGLLSKGSVYVKDQPELSKEDLYIACQYCLGSLFTLFEEASDITACDSLVKNDTSKPLIECIRRQVDNINWLLEIMLDQQMADEFVDMWADQQELTQMHQRSSPMVRYEVSRVSASLFIAIGTRRLHCRSEVRMGLLQSWFGPMLLDFGWLQRCRKGLDMKVLEEAMGQVLLTLPLKQQHFLFMEWFRCFSKHGSECPNLSKAFQIWWRRSSSRGWETCAAESR